MSNGNGRYSPGCLVLSFLLGGAMGAGLTMLLAPRSGPETREKIKDETLKVAEEAKERTEELLEKTRQMVEEKMSLITSAIEAGKEAMEAEKQRLVARLKKETEGQQAAEAEG